MVLYKKAVPFYQIHRNVGNWVSFTEQKSQIPENTSYFRGAFKTHSNIYDGAICENSWRIKAVNYFRKKASS